MNKNKGGDNYNLVLEGPCFDVEDDKGREKVERIRKAVEALAEELDDFVINGTVKEQDDATGSLMCLNGDKTAVAADISSMLNYASGCEYKNLCEFVARMAIYCVMTGGLVEDVPKNESIDDFRDTVEKLSQHLKSFD